MRRRSACTTHTPCVCAALLCGAPSANPRDSQAVSALSGWQLRCAWAGLVTTAGVGCLSFPHTYKQGGLGGAGVLSLVVGAMMIFSLQTLVRGAHFYKAQTFPELARKAVGPAHGRLASTTLGLALTFFVFGSLVAYQVVAGDVFPAICEQLVDGHPTQLCSRSGMILLSACLLSLPICLGARSLAALSAVAVFSIGALSYTVAVVVYSSVQHILQNPQTLQDVDWGFNLNLSEASQALPVMVFAFQMQSTVVAIFRELEDFPTWFGRGAVTAEVREEQGEWEEEESDGERVEGEGERVSGNGHGQERCVALVEEGMSHPLLGMRPTASDHGKLRGMTTVICLAVFICWFLYSLMGSAAYLAYNKQLKSDVLDVFPKGSKALQAARGLMGLSTAVVAYPINIFVIRQSVRFLLTDAAGITLGTGTGTHLALTLGAFTASLAVALSVDDLGTVFGVIGGTTGAAIVFVFPGIVKLCHVRDELKARPQRDVRASSVAAVCAAWVMVLVGAGVFLNTLVQAWRPSPRASLAFLVYSRV